MSIVPANPTAAAVPILAALLLGGCARFQPQPLSPATHFEQLEQRSLTSAELKTFLESARRDPLVSWPPPSWDLDLLTLAAFYYQPSLAVARSQWAVAQGGETTAAQRPNPNLNVTPGYSSTTAIPSPWLPLTMLDVPIETAGKRGYRRAQAAHLSEAARLNVATVAWQVRSALRASLLDLNAAQRRQALLQTQLASQEQIVNLLNQQVQAGAISSSEALPQRIALQKARLDLNDAQRLEADARTRVAEAIGIPVRALDEVKLSFDWTKTFDSAAHLSSAEVRRQALLSRPDILGVLAEYAAAESELQLQIARQYPDVHIWPGYQYDQGNNKWSLGMTVDLPILNQNQGPIAEAKARRQQVAARFDAAQAKALAEIERATQALYLAQTNTAGLRSLVEEQARRRDAVAAQLKAGATDQLDFLNAQLEYQTAELSQLDSLLRLQQALGALEDAVQRPFELPPIIFQAQQKDAHAKP